jgi:hypothetical protein
VTLLWLTLVVRKFVGVVGGVRSPRPAAATEPTTTNPRTRASAAPAARRTTAFFAVMSFLLVRMPVGRMVCASVIGGNRVIGLTPGPRELGDERIDVEE